MKNTRSKTSCVIQAPPPVHGFSLISEKFVRYLDSHTIPNKIYDVTPRKLYLPFLSLAKFIIDNAPPSGRSKFMYIGVSGGVRQIIDFLFVIAANLFKINVICHHHSFAYLNAKRMYTRIFFHALYDAKHIVLCAKMAHLLSEKYSIPANNITVLSNAAFLNDPEIIGVVESRANKPHLGFISNITQEKGIFTFLDCLKELRRNGLLFSAIIAGPLDSSIKDRFFAELSALQNDAQSVQYVGAIYGLEKAEFFQKIDYLLFPTAYINEAEPVTILEALSFGVKVLSLDRGCIFELLEGSTSHVRGDFSSFYDVLADEVQKWMMQSAYRTACRRTSIEYFKHVKDDNESSLRKIIESLR